MRGRRWLGEVGDRGGSGRLRGGRGLGMVSPAWTERGMRVEGALAVHEIRDVDGARDALGVGIGQGACVAQGPAERVGENDYGPDGLDSRVWARHVCGEAVDGFFLATGSDIAPKSACEAVPANWSLHRGVTTGTGLRAMVASSISIEQMENPKYSSEMDGRGRKKGCGGVAWIRM